MSCWDVRLHKGTRWEFYQGGPPGQPGGRACHPPGYSQHHSQGLWEQSVPRTRHLVLRARPPCPVGLRHLGTGHRFSRKAGLLGPQPHPGPGGRPLPSPAAWVSTAPHPTRQEQIDRRPRRIMHPPTAPPGPCAVSGFCRTSRTAAVCNHEWLRPAASSSLPLPWPPARSGPRAYGPAGV